MSTTLPLHSHAPPTTHTYSREQVIAAIHDFYSLLTKLPYVEPDALVLPPADGWSGINATELRKRGKSEEVIDLLRRLPYLRGPAPGRRWMLGPDTIAIAYCDGEVYDGVMESIQPVPAHCVWLTEMESRDGTSLLLDTRIGTVTEWTIMEHKVMLDYDEYVNVPAQDKWMAHATMPATAFFQLWERKFEKLVWMVIYNPRGLAGTAQWYRTATTPQEEEDMLLSDDEFQLDGDVGDEVEDGTDSDGEDYENEEEEGSRVSTEEVDKLMEDAYGDKAKQSRIGLQSPENATEDEEVDLPDSTPVDHRQPLIADLHGEIQEVYGIYTRNGWPSDFDREECKMQLAEFLGCKENPASRS